MRTTITAFLLVVIGAAGYLIGNYEKAPTLPPKTGSLAADNNRLLNEVALLRAELAASKAEVRLQPPPIANPTVQRENKLAGLTDKTKPFSDAQRAWFAANPKPSPYRIFSSRNWTLSDAVIKALNIQPQEAAALQTVLANAKNDFDRLTSSSAMLTSADTNKVVVTVPPLPEGATIFRSMVSEFENVLGATRAETLIELGFGDLNAPFAYFGTGEHEFTFTRMTTQSGTEVIHLLDSPKPPPGLDGYANTARSFTSTTTAPLPPHYEWLGRFLDQFTGTTANPEQLNR
jgi:hypothetical protein